MPKAEIIKEYIKIKFPTIHGKVQGTAALNYSREATVK